MTRSGEDSDKTPSQENTPASGAAHGSHGSSDAGGAGGSQGAGGESSGMDLGRSELSSGGRGSDSYGNDHSGSRSDGDDGDASGNDAHNPGDNSGDNRSRHGSRGDGADEAVRAAPSQSLGAQAQAQAASGWAGGGGYPPRLYVEDLEAADADRGDGYEDDDDDDGQGSGRGKRGGGILPEDFWGHVEALRWVVLKSALVFVGFMMLMMFFSVRAQKLLTWPLSYGIKLSGAEHVDVLLRTDGPFSVFTFMLQLWVFGGLLLSLPFILYFAADFIAPGLTPREKRLLRPVAFSALGLFFVGCLFAFFLLLPTYMAVSLTLEDAFGFASLWTPANYYGAVVWTTLGLGLVFEFPLVLVILQWVGLLSADTLRKYRRHAFVFMLVFSAFLTPGGDPITLFMATLPLYALFEASLLVGDRIAKKRREREHESDEDEL